MPGPNLEQASTLTEYQLREIVEHMRETQREAEATEQRQREIHAEQVANQQVELDRLIEQRRIYHDRYSHRGAQAWRQINQFFNLGDLHWYELFFVCPSCMGRHCVERYSVQHDLCESCCPLDRPRGNPYDSDDVYRWICEDHAVRPCLDPYGKAPHFGIELEVEVEPQDSAALAQAAKEVVHIVRDDEFAIVKRDGSLRCGFEITTRPASRDYHKHRWNRFFDKKPSAIVIQPSCGLHVHVARRGMTDLTIAKIVCFVNAYHNRAFIQTMAGRSANSYCQIKNKKLTTACEWAGDRYEAVNLANPHTIEFRMFKGTLNRSVFFKALEFCDAVRAFCSPASRSLRESMMRSEFTQFVHSGSKMWPHLDAFIQAKWYGRASKLTEMYGFTPVAKDKRRRSNKLRPMTRPGMFGGVLPAPAEEPYMWDVEENLDEIAPL
jgi:hypothetical protein